MKSMSCSLDRSSSGTFWVILLSFLVLSLLVQSCRLNQNGLVQAASMNQRGQGETNRLDMSNQLGAGKPSFKSLSLQSAISNPPSVSSNPSNPQSAIQNPQSKAEVIQKTAKLQMPFIANNGQMDKKVKFYANTFGGSVFVTKDGEIVYALPKSGDVVDGETHRKAAKCAKERSEKHISHQDTKNTGEMTSWRVQVCNLNPGVYLDNGALFNQWQNQPYNLSSTQIGETWGSNCKFEPAYKSPTSIGDPKSAIQNLSPTSIGEPKSGVVLREEFVGTKVKTIQGEQPSVTKVNYFKGNDPSKWKTNISTYDVINLGEVYHGIELKLKAYGSNVEKLFYVKPGADPEHIKISLGGIQPPESPFIKGDGINNSSYKGGAAAKSPLEKGARGLLVNKYGELEVETELGPVKFTKPVAYQIINGKKIEVDVEYDIQGAGVRDQGSSVISVSSLDPCLLPHVPLIDSQLKTQNSKHTTVSTLPDTRHTSHIEYGFKVASYDKTKELVIDPLLASTFLGGSSYNYANVIAVDSSGDIYVAGNTSSSDFPTTTGAYDTTYNGSDSYGGDTFVSKLNGDLTSLIASTYLGGSRSDYNNSISVDKDGNIYVAGYTLSEDFPTVSSCYDTSYNGGGYGGDVFVSKLNGNLTSLLASTYLGGSNSDYSYSIAIDSNGNICMTGQTDSSDFPITTGTYDTSSDPSGYNDAFVSRLNSDLTTLLASTFLGGTNGEGGNSITIDTDGNIYVTGWTSSSNFPTTTDAYDTSYNGNDYTLGDGNYYGHDIFVSKLNSDLTNLLASTYLGGYEQDYVNSIAIDSGGDIYVAGRTWSSNFPTTSGAYDTSYAYNGQTEAYVSKLNGDLTSLLASTYLGGNSYDEIHSIVINSEGNIYVTGGTYSSGFPTTSGAYDTYSHSDSDGGDAFISKLDGTLSNLLASTFLGGSGGDDLGSSIAIDSSGNIYVAGYTYSIDFPATTGTYDTSYNGDENSHYDAFVSKLDSNLSAGGNIVPAPTPSPKPSYPAPGPTMPSPSPTPEVKAGKILGYVLNIKGNHVKSVKLKLKGVNSKVLKKTTSDEDGLFEFADLDADTYTITALKKGYKTVKQTLTLEAGEEKDIEIVMKKTRKKTRETILQ